MASYITLEHLDQTVWSLIQKINTVAEEPHFYASPAAGITSEQIASWNDKPTMTTVNSAINNATNNILNEAIVASVKQIETNNTYLLNSFTIEGIPSIKHYFRWYGEDTDLSGLQYNVKVSDNISSIVDISYSRSQMIKSIKIGNQNTASKWYSYIYNLPLPTVDHQAVNKQYVDDRINNITTGTTIKVRYYKTNNTADKSFTELETAYDAGHFIYLRDSNGIEYRVINKDSITGFLFESFGGLDRVDGSNSPVHEIFQLKLSKSNVWTSSYWIMPSSLSDFNNDLRSLKTTASADNSEYNLLGTIYSNNNTTPATIYQQTHLSFCKTTEKCRLNVGSATLPGYLRLHNTNADGQGYTDLITAVGGLHARTITFPDASGTVALTTDIPSVPSWALQSTKPTYTASEVGATTSSEVSSMISSAVSSITSFSTEIVSTLPTSGQTGRFYFVPNSSSVEQNIYDEYIYVDNKWEKLGAFNSGTIDLNGYILKSELAEWAKASTKPTYTASEVGALPSNTSYVSSFNGQSGAITYIPPVTSVNGQTGAVTITIPEADDHKWGGITLGSGRKDTTNNIWVPCLSSAVNTDGTAYWVCATQEIPPTSDNNANLIKIARYKYINAAWYLQSTTPSANDNSTKVATTAYVDSADTALAARITTLENIPWATYYTGSSEPQSKQGNDGDLYFQTGE